LVSGVGYVGLTGADFTMLDNLLAGSADKNRVHFVLEHCGKLSGIG